MYWRCLSRLAVTGAMLAAGIVSAAPASAAVTYDPETMSGFVAATDLRKALGWTAAKLTSRADGVVFDHDFWIKDTYSVQCGQRRYPVVHHRVYGRYELTDAVVRRDGPRSSVGYGDGITGFRLTGASSGISGTSVAPSIGQPCPAAPGSTIDGVRLVSSATGWALGVRSGEVRRELLASG